MANKTEVQALTDLGDISTGDKLLGEKVEGTTGLINYIVNVEEDTSPTLGGNLDLNSYNINNTTPTEISYLEGVTSNIQTQFNDITQDISDIESDITDLENNKADDTDVVKHDSFSSNGYMVRTDVGAYTTRSIEGTLNQIDISNGEGTSGNTTISISSSYVGQPSITTLGTITTGTWNGTTIDVANGGTGLTSTTPYGVILAGTTSTGAFQVVDPGTAGYVLTSNGNAAAPTFEPLVVAEAADAASSGEVATGTEAAKYVSPATQHYHQSSAKAWVNFDGTGTIAIRDSYNVSSITDGGNGNYTINFSTSMASGNYCVIGAANLSTGGVHLNSFSSSGANVTTRTAGAVATDASLVNVVVHGDI